MKTPTIIGLATAALVIAMAPLAPAQEAPKPDSSGYVTANGVKYWFEIHGKGEPLLLLHGGLGSTGMFGPVLSKLAENRRVIGVDLHGHGRTELGTRKVNLIDIANDLAVVVRALGLQQVDAAGYSFGGGAALRLAVQHPTLVRRLVVASAPYAQNGFFPEMLPQQAGVGAAMADMGEFMRQPYDWSADVKKLTMPVLLVYGDSDMIRPEHIVSFYQLLGGGLKDAGWQREHMSKNRLAILPNLTHYEAFLSPAWAATVLPFVNGESGAPTWK
jgi:pimeloyl-ACP methyl ester carboxylesterase